MAMTRTEIQSKYDSKNCRNFTLKFNLKYDADVIKKLDNVPSRNGYIKELIRQDLACTCPEKSSISVPFSPAAMSTLEEKAKEKGLSVPDLIAVIVNEQLIRTCSEKEGV